MATLILVLVLLMASVAIFGGVTFYRGRFRLAPIPLKTKGHFVLMLKKDKSQEDEKDARQFSKCMGGQAEDNVAPPSPKN